MREHGEHNRYNYRALWLLSEVLNTELASRSGACGLLQLVPASENLGESLQTGASQAPTTATRGCAWSLRVVSRDFVYA